MPALPHVYRNVGSATKCLQACIDNIQSREGEVKAWAALNLNGARAAAAVLDEEAAVGQFRGPLHGMPLGVKDLFDVAGFQTRAGSLARAHVAVASSDAPLVAALRAAGCVIVGKTHTTEFAYLDPTVTVNPFNPAHTPGGSSSGSGAAVGAAMVPLALGTQTVGSVCRPAAYCGAAAFKPTTGSTLMTQVVPFSTTYDTVGFFAPLLELAIEAWHAVCVAGAADPGSLPAANSQSSSRTRRVKLSSLKGLRFAIPADHFFSQVDDDIALALQVTANLLQRAGATRIDLTLGVDLSSMRARQRTVMFREAALLHQELFAGDRATFDRLGRHWREGLSFGNTISAVDYAQARADLQSISAAALQVAGDVDVLLVPAAKSTAPTKETTGDPGLILPWTIFGSPLAVLPLGLSATGLPIAIMLAGRPGADARLATIALAVQGLIQAAGGGTPIRALI